SSSTRPSTSRPGPTRTSTPATTPSGTWRSEPEAVVGPCSLGRHLHTDGVPAFRSKYRRKALIAAVVFNVVGTLIARRLGYPVGGNVVVRCRRGHLFTTLWIPGASLKAIRLGWWRIQRCPVGPHWSIVVPVREADLSTRELRRAHELKDLRVP